MLLLELTFREERNINELPNFEVNVEVFVELEEMNIPTMIP